MGRPPVLILGAGINGCALARELAVNGVPTCVVDAADLASGATAYSTRLIHGGLRYLEHLEFGLVRESLAERGWMLRLASEYVRPLQIAIPVRRRAGGLARTLAGILGLRSSRPGRARAPRGLWLVRMGLSLYDFFARDAALPRHMVVPVGNPSFAAVDRPTYRWLCCYWDGQVRYPERLAIAMLSDAVQAGRERDAPCEVFTYCRAVLDGSTVALTPTGRGEGGPPRRFAPVAVINATGAWVDRTLAALNVPSAPLLGPTKGSHLVTFHAGLREALGGQGLYAEAADGRPVFLLPLGEGTLVGTTDIPFDEPPERATATEDELAYLIDAIGRVFPTLRFERQDVDFHFAGVRPLPRVTAASPAGITRRHFIHEHKDAAVLLYSLVGGKLTTCRSLAEEMADRLFARLGIARIASTRDRPIVATARRANAAASASPGLASGSPVPWQELSDSLEASYWQGRALWERFGARSVELARSFSPAEWESLDATDVPRGAARWCVIHEWATTLGDLVERRLMLLYEPVLTPRCLAQLGEILAGCGRLEPGQVAAEVDRYARYLEDRYGKKLGEERPLSGEAAAGRLGC